MSIARRGAAAYGAVVDTHTDPIVVMLTEAVSDAHLLYDNVQLSFGRLPVQRWRSVSSSGGGDLITRTIKNCGLRAASDWCGAGRSACIVFGRCGASAIKASARCRWLERGRRRVCRGTASPADQLPGRLFDPKTARRQQDDPRSFRQLLRRRMRPHQVLQLPFLFER
jgi:hypothetical protein